FYKYHFEVAVWPMMLGFCCEYRKVWFNFIPANWFRIILFGSLLVFTTTVILLLCGFKLKLPVIAIGTFAFVPCFLSYLGNRPLGGISGRVLTWLGERTYSIYLWQQPFTICDYLPNNLHPVGSLLATIVGGIWFRFFEQPFLSTTRKRFVQQSTNR